MEKIIDGRMYNTFTATPISTWCNGQYGNTTYVEETLYKKRNGEFFLYGLSGAGGKYAERIDENNYSGGSKIITFTESKAKEWLETFGTTEEYIKAFGEPEE